jgi:tripartite-type tricarboxylate transporter receptor subunit TctC
MYRRILNTFVLAGAAAILAWTTLAEAQPYPSRAVRIVVPTPAGGPWDVLARILARHLTEQMASPFVVDNRPGGAATLGTKSVAIASPDGYTLLIAGLATMALAPAVNKQLSYDPATDFSLVSLVSTHSYALVGRPDLPVTDVRGLVEHARANPGKLSIATAGPGTGQHLAAAMLRLLSGIDLVMIPYKGSAPAYLDVLAGRVDLFFDNTSAVVPHVGSGKLKAYAVSSPERSPLLPNVPTVREAGIGNFEMEGWVGVVAPAGTPGAVVEKLRGEIGKVVRTEEFRTIVEKGGGRVLQLSAADTQAFVASEMKRWDALVRRAGIPRE